MNLHYLPQRVTDGRQTAFDQGVMQAIFRLSAEASVHFLLEHMSSTDLVHAVLNSAGKARST